MIVAASSRSGAVRTVDNLEAAIRDMTELYLRLDLPKVWGDGKRVHEKLRDRLGTAGRGGATHLPSSPHVPNHHGSYTVRLCSEG